MVWFLYVSRQIIFECFHRFYATFLLTDDLFCLDIVTTNRKWVFASKEKILLEQLRDAIFETIAWGRSCYRVAVALDPSLGVALNPSASESESSKSRKTLARGVTFGTIRAGTVVSADGIPPAAEPAAAPWRAEAKVLADTHGKWVSKNPEPVLE